MDEMMNNEIDLQPLVSIVLPTYNGAKYIRESIDSCLNQTYRNIELIIVDDCSTDATPQIVQSYRDERIRYIKHRKNRRLPQALNTGFAEAKGEYLTWTSDDNIYVENAIEKMFSFLKKNSCSFVYSDHYQFTDDDFSERKHMSLPDKVALERLNMIGACFLYSREVKEAIGDYDPDTELAEDYDYFIRISKRFSLRHLAEPLYYYRVHGESLYNSRYFEVKIVDFLVRLKNELLEVDQITDLYLRLLMKNKKRLFRLRHRLAKMLFLQRITNILQNYQKRNIAFRKAKSDLSSIMSYRFLDLLAIWEPSNESKTGLKKKLRAFRSKE